jgi:hypothetical protein
MKLRPVTLLFLRIAAFIILASCLPAQFYFNWSIPRPDITLFDDYPPENFTAEDFNRSLPFDEGEYDDTLVQIATDYFHLPTWSHAYSGCRSHPEISCFELIRAYHTVHNYLAKYNTNELIGYVKARLSASAPLHCRMATFYNSFIVALFTGRRLIFETNETRSAWLRPEHRTRFSVPAGLPKRSRIIANNFTFTCEELMVRNQVIEIDSCMWPQISYLHNDLGGRLRSQFGFHAAYYLGNFLFDIDPKNCALLDDNVTVAVTHRGKEFQMDRRTFERKMIGCESERNLVFLEENEAENDEENLCKIRQMMSADKILYSFGAVIPWFAMAMQGRKGAVVDLDGDKCMEMRNSQSGSIIHTYNPRKFFHYSTNNDFLVCGPNFNHARFFMRYLLW